MAKIIIEVPDEVCKQLKVLASAKGVMFEDFCTAAFVAGLAKHLRKGFNLKKS